MTNGNKNNRVEGNALARVSPPHHMRFLRLALAVQRYNMLAWLSDLVSGFSRLSDFFSLPVALSHQFKCHTADMKPNHQRDVRWVEVGLPVPHPLMLHTPSIGHLAHHLM